MRGKISDQDLTDYALNELQPEERLYLESMLAISEECRHDIYQMIEVGQMLDEGFEAEEDLSQTFWLTGAQRNKLVHFRRTPALWQRATGVVALAACAAFLLTHPLFWQMNGTSREAVAFSNSVSTIDSNSATATPVNFSTPLASFAAFADDTASWLPTVSEVLDPMVCTPPSWVENAHLTIVSDGP